MSTAVEVPHGTSLHHRQSAGDPAISSPTNVIRQTNSEDLLYTLKRADFEDTLLPNGNKSLSLIAIQAFTLGLVLALSVVSSIYLATAGYQLWRLPSFISALCIFHFLEFYTTAHWNTPAALASSFLLYSNGWTWHFAHSCAMIELIATTVVAPAWQLRFVPPWLQALAFVAIVAGQIGRSTAMAQAGTNFNHIPARYKQAGHVLVTSGIYSISRHPSYASFFWWALGTQIFIGNKFCAIAYTVVLWRFFNSRIITEEKYLNQFFGERYAAYKQRTRTWIPFIR